MIDYKYLLEEDFDVHVEGMTQEEMKQMYDDLREAQQKQQEVVDADIEDALWEERHISF